MNDRLIWGGVAMVFVGIYFIATSNASGDLYTNIFGKNVATRVGFGKNKSGNYLFPLAGAGLSFLIAVALIVAGILGADPK